MYKPKLFQYRHAGDKGDRRCSSLISALYGVSGQCHILSSLNPTERTLGTHWTRGWVGLKAGLDTEVKGKIPLLCYRSNPARPVIQSVARHYTY
jgi:hypothetical protein